MESLFQDSFLSTYLFYNRRKAKRLLVFISSSQIFKTTDRSLSIPKILLSISTLRPNYFYLDLLKQDLVWSNKLRVSKYKKSGDHLGPNCHPRGTRERDSIFVSLFKILTVPITVLLYIIFISKIVIITALCLVK